MMDIYIDCTSHSGFVVYAGKFQMAQCDSQAQAAHAMKSIVIKHGAAWLIVENRQAGFYELVKNGQLFTTDSSHAVLAAVIERGRK